MSITVFPLYTNDKASSWSKITHSHLVNSLQFVWFSSETFTKSNYTEWIISNASGNPAICRSELGSSTQHFSISDEVGYLVSFIIESFTNFLSTTNLECFTRFVPDSSSITWGRTEDDISDAFNSNSLLSNPLKRKVHQIFFLFIDSLKNVSRPITNLSSLNDNALLYTGFFFTRSV